MAADTGRRSESFQADALLFACLADRAAEDAQIVLVGSCPRQETLPNCMNTTVCWQVFPLFALSPAGAMRQPADKMPRKRASIPRNPELATLGEAIELLMKRRGITQTDVANACDLEVKQVGSYARGQTGPSYRNLRRLCRGLGVTRATLILTIEELEGEAEQHTTVPTPDDMAGAVR